MVSKIFISNKPNFIPNNWSCYKTIEQFHDEIHGITKNKEDEDEDDCYVEKFDDMAQCTAFYELGYWDSEKDLNNKKSSEVRENVQKSIQRLIDEGVKPAVISEDGYAHWWFGKLDIQFPNQFFYKGIKLPIEMRKSALLFHLNAILETTFDYDDTHTFYHY
jgi:hypothetical protein